MFHPGKNWFFQRLENGDVEISHRIPGGSTDPIYWDIDSFYKIDKCTWASIVASVSSHGETRDTWIAALEFHEGK